MLPPQRRRRGTAADPAAKRHLQGRSPLQIVATEAGARLVEEWLHSIDEGMAAQVVLWRISNHRSLAGGGALRAPGRWHTRGRRIVYCAQTPAAALLETLVHVEIEVRDLPTRYRLLKIEALLNPTHKDAPGVVVRQVSDHVIDPRLLE